MSPSVEMGAPVMHAVGMLPGDVRYEFQSGVGMAPPMHETWRYPFASPVFTDAPESRLAGIIERNSPIPPRSTPSCGEMNVPSGLPIIHMPLCFFVRFQVKPMRGLTCIVFGAKFVRAPNAASTAGL